jgi:1-deoxy-D-xylulose-5-phosphate synthase
MSKILDGINEPADLKGLSVSELKQLASEIREELLSTVTANGGHLASNLGVVELTITLHRAFDSPKDKLVWDVGHQTYVHKLLTGRKDSFSSIRQHGGLSGFTDRSESPHDVFGAGHASTSVSAAMGMAVARDLSGEDYHVVAIIGDGSLTGGMALEALNQAGHQGTNFIVVLNDNGMAISPSVGALARLFNRVRRDKRYHRAKGRAERFVTGLPLGSYLWGIGRRIKDAVKGIVMPSTVWEKLGFFYIGPIDGHDIAQMEADFLQAKDYPAKPIFVHVVTTKGKGYRPAEADAVGFHGVPPNGGQLKVAPSYSEVFGQTLLAITREDPG